MNNPITKAGFENVKNKFDKMSKERIDLVEKKEQAYQQGDPSDNPEYESCILELDNHEREMKKLEDIIFNSNVIDSTSFSLDSVKFGLTVVLQNENDDSNIKEFTIVGTNEVDATNGKISNLSPLGSKLLGKKVDDDDILIGDEAYFVIQIKRN